MQRGVPLNMISKERIILPFKEVESWERQKKEEYYLKLREECFARNRKENGWNAFIKTLARFLRHFELEIRGEEKIPDSTECNFKQNDR